MNSPDSRQVSWWPVYEHAVRHAAGLGVDLAEPVPVAGTPAWLNLPDGDRRTTAAVLLLGAQFALYLDGRQEAQAEASQAVSESADWSNVAREVQQLRDFRARNPWAKKVVD